MDERNIIWLLISCCIGAVMGFQGTTKFGGAIFYTCVVLIGAFAGWTQGMQISALQVIAPIIFAYVAAFFSGEKAR